MPDHDRHITVALRSGVSFGGAVANGRFDGAASLRSAELRKTNIMIDPRML
jgi:hypothetical protein